jgi:hypothetical protein
MNRLHRHSSSPSFWIDPSLLTLHLLPPSQQVQDLAATFASLARLEELRSARSAQQEAAAATAAEVAEAAGLPVPDPVKELFAQLDSDRDGK